MIRMTNFSFLPYVLLTVIAVCIPIIYLLPSLASRLVIILSLSTLLILTWYFASKRKWQIPLFLTFVVAAVLIFITSNLTELEPFLSGVGFSETEYLAQASIQQGSIVFSSAHSYFPQMPLMINYISQICGVPLTWADFIIVSLFIFTITVIGVYFMSVIRHLTNNSYIFFASAVSFLIVCYATASIDLGYKDLAYLSFLLLLCYVLKNGFKSRVCSITILILTIGVTIGSPTGIILMAFLFLFYALIKRNVLPIVYAAIPITYFIYFAPVYMDYIKTYVTFAWNGLTNFLTIISAGQLPARVAPWARTSLASVQDVYMSSAINLSLLTLAGLTTLILLLMFLKEKPLGRKKNGSPIFWAIFLCMLILLVIAVATYIGTSVMPEQSFSDIRTATLSFIMAFLPFMFMSRQLMKKIHSIKLLTVLFVLLIFASSFVTIYSAYPKSINDKINVVEDSRLNFDSVYYTGMFLNEYTISGDLGINYKIGMDYKISNQIQGYILGDRYNYTTKLFTAPFSLDSYQAVFFDTYGLQYPSIYISPALYQEAYNFSMANNVIYNSGNIIGACNPSITSSNP